MLNNKPLSQEHKLNLLLTCVSCEYKNDIKVTKNKVWLDSVYLMPHVCNLIKNTEVL